LYARLGAAPGQPGYGVTEANAAVESIENKTTNLEHQFNLIRSSPLPFYRSLNRNFKNNFFLCKKLPYMSMHFHSIY
jgi:hypothetical protein